MRMVKRLKRNVGISGAAIVSFEAVTQRTLGFTIDHDANVHSVSDLQQYAAYMLDKHDREEYSPPDWLIDLRQRNDNKINAAAVAGAFICASIDLLLEEDFTYDVALTPKERNANKVRSYKKIS